MSDRASSAVGFLLGLVTAEVLFYVSLLTTGVSDPIKDYACLGTVLCDHFTGANGTLLTNHNLSVPQNVAWTQFGGSGANVVIQSNQAQQSTTDASGIKCYAESNKSDVTITCAVTVPGSHWCALLLFRFVDTSNFWLAQFYSNDVTGGVNCNFTKVVAGTGSNPDTQTKTISNSTTHTFSVVLSGNSVISYCDGVQSCSCTDSALATATKHGICTLYAGSGDTANICTYDEFKVTSP